jgi:hypothetical protein
MKRIFLVFMVCSSPVMAENFAITNMSCNFVVRQTITPPDYATTLYEAVEPYTVRDLNAIVRIDGVHLNPIQVEDVVRQAVSICMDGQETHWFEALRHAILGDQWKPLTPPLPEPKPIGMEPTYNEARDRAAYFRSRR